MIFDKVDGTFNEVVFFSTSLKTFNEVVFFSTSLKFQNDMWRPLTHFKATKAKKVPLTGFEPAIFWTGRYQRPRPLSQLVS